MNKPKQNKEALIKLKKINKHYHLNNLNLTSQCYAKESIEQTNMYKLNSFQTVELNEN